MAVLRVDYQALAAIGREMGLVPDQLGVARGELLGLRSSMTAVGDLSTENLGYELLRRLGWLVEMGAVTSAGLAASLLAAAGDYGTADQTAVRFEGG